MPPSSKARHTEHGNVFIIILIAIVLFGALSYTISRGFQSGTTNKISKQQATLAASEILNYAQQIERAINRLRRNGCGENQISFESALHHEASANPRAPSDKSCHLFDPDGANMEYYLPPEKYLSPTSVLPASSFLDDHGQIAFVGSARVTDLGDNDKADPMLVIPWLDSSICDAINEKTGATGTNERGVWFGHYLGVLAIREPPDFMNEMSEEIYCSEVNDNDGRAPYTFHYVVIAR